jgi:4-hydroxy-tetrahydrodipicolinate synthase
MGEAVIPEYCKPRRVSWLPMTRFGSVLTAMITPFNDDLSLDLDGAQKLANWLVDHGNEGLIITGTTGEAPTLSHEEQVQVVAAVVDAVGDRASVIAGSGSNDTASAVKNTVAMSAAGADGVLVVAPYYNKPGQAGLYDHFRVVAAATDLPVILYDIPGRTGRKISTETILSLVHDVENIVALKDAAGDPSETAVLISQAPDDFEVYSGDDALTLPLLAVGAVGTIGVATHWTAPEHQEMFAALAAGNLAKATLINQAMLPSFAFETGDELPNPIPTKAVMKVLGLPSGPCRPPMGPVHTDLTNEATAILSTTAIGREYGLA